SHREHFANFPSHAFSGNSRRSRATARVFPIALWNAAPTGIRAALCGSRSAGATIMIPTHLSPPLALRPREAAKALGISARHLWQLTKDGHIPCVRVGS